MRRGFLALLLVLAGGCRRDPRSPLRLAAGIENHDFAVDLTHGRVLFVEGEYPMKSYLHAEPLAGGWRSHSFRVPGFSLTGHVLPLRDGAQAVVEARHASDDEESERSLLKVDLKTGALIADYPLEGAQVRALAEPRWSSAPVAAVQDSSGLRLAALEAGADLRKGVPLAAEAAGVVAIAEDYPVIAAAAWDKSGQGALRLFDAGSGRHGRELRLRAPTFIKARGGGHWLVTIEDEKSRGNTVVELDETLGKAKPLFSSSDAVETAVAGKRWLFAVAVSSAIRAAGDPRFLHPRELHRVDLTGAEPPLTLPWTKRRGELLAFDEDAGRLYFAVTDKDDAALWSLDAAPDRLREAAARIDRANRLPLGMLSAVALSLLFMAFLVGTIWLLIDGPR